MTDLELLRLNLDDIANNLHRAKENRINEINHNMDIETFENTYKESGSTLPTNIPEDIEQGNTDLEMYENWLKN